jgi:hypothetical protein
MYAYKMLLSLSSSNNNNNKFSLAQVVNGKAISLKAWTGLKVSRRKRLPDVKTIGI